MVFGLDKDHIHSNEARTTNEGKRIREALEYIDMGVGVHEIGE